jgi:hypothetical integral membrane protein (TIGR02206 family)
MSFLSAEHLVPLVLVVLVSAGLARAARLRPGPWLGPAAKALSLVIFLAGASWYIYRGVGGSWSSARDLPIQLCDITEFVAAAALWWRLPLLIELTYFWGLGGSLQALLTPDLNDPFPTYPYMQFYLAHGGIVVAAIFLVIGLRLYPRPGSVLRIIAITLAFTALVAGVDVLTGGNYMYLRRPPVAGSLLDFMGAWPWYIATGAGLAVVILAVLDAPFWAGRRRAQGRRRAEIGPHPN